MTGTSGKPKIGPKFRSGRSYLLSWLGDSASVFPLSPCPLVPLPPCPLASLSPCPLASLSPCPLVPLSPCPLVPASIFPWLIANPVVLRISCADSRYGASSDRTSKSRREDTKRGTGSSCRCTRASQRATMGAVLPAR